MNHVTQHNVISGPIRGTALIDEFGAGVAARSELNIPTRPYRSGSAASDRLTSQAKPVGREWQRWVDDAGRMWRQLTEEDLQELESRRKTLGALVRTRYSLSADEADKQVTRFIEDHQLCAL